MNYYIFIPLVAFTINTFTWTYIFAQKRGNPVNRAYLLLAADLAIWSIGGIVVWSPIKPSLLLPIWKLYSIVWIISGFCFLNFSYAFLKIKKDYIYYFFLMVALVSTVLSLSSDLFINGYVTHYWGTSQSPGALFVPIVLLSITAPMVYALSIMYKTKINTDDTYLKNQLRLIINGTFITLGIGLVFDVILPDFFNINSVLRVSTLGTVVWLVFIFRAITKYNFLSLGVEEVSNDLFTNVKDAIVLSDINGFMIQVNDSAKELFQLEGEDIRRINTSKFFQSYNFDETYKNYETVINVNNKRRDVSISQATVKQYGVELGRILIVRDITENKMAEKELQDSKTKLENLARELAQANASLEQKVADRTRSLLRSNERLQREIAERTRAEAELAAEKERLSVTLRSIGDGVITTDTAGHIVLLNEAAESLTGWPAAEATGQSLETVFQVLDEKTRLSFQSPVEEALSTDSIVSRPDQTLLVARDGTEHLIAESAAPIRDKDGKVVGVVLVFRDVTDRRRIEEELLKADKLESIGTLAGGIAHDFNNILTAIIGNISLAKLYADAQDRVFTRLANAEKAALQAQNLTQQLLTFSKGGSLVLRPISIGHLIRDCIDFSLRGSNVRCELDLADNIWPVEIDEGQISQVINNLIINADQAMPDGGLIHVHVENALVDEGDSNLLYPLPKGKYVRISVQDSGVGIPEEHLQKIFDPYFTTKQKGSGLGLFTCYSIVKKHNGHLAVDSAEGMGTTFCIYLPASKKRVRKEVDKQTVDVVGKGKILVMEDDETIRDVMGEMLSHFGYDVAFARDGHEAIDLYRQAQEARAPFDMAIMDLTIPGGMGAKETIAKIREFDPQIKALIASGYANNPIMIDYTQYGFCGRIVKPYKSEELYNLLHGLIASPQT